MGNAYLLFVCVVSEIYPALAGRPRTLSLTLYRDMMTACLHVRMGPTSELAINHGPSLGLAVWVFGDSGG